MIKKITQKEWNRFVEPQLVTNGFSRQEREALRSAFFHDLKDVDYGERQTFFSNPVPGITEEELKVTMEALRDKNSDLSKSMDVRLYNYPERLDLVEKILKEALEGDKEPRWF